MLKREPLMARKQLWQLLDKSASGWLNVFPQLATDTVPLFGVEIEVENYNSWLISMDGIVDEFNKFEAVADHSLRNNGIEFRSSGVMDFKTASHCTSKMLTWLGKQRCEFSHRTSIHVHNNMLFKSLEEIRKYISWYFMAERALYRFAGRNRNYNNFCVPMHALPRLRMYLDSPKHLPKYAGLGGCRFNDLGTLEWRHMPGTTDGAKVVKWLRMIGNLDAYTSQEDCVSPLELEPDKILTMLCELFPDCDFSIDEVICDFFHLKGYM